ncbi:MAG: hypothetical protein Wins2KO_04170 [Winogradskyella sp.]
MKIFLAIVLTFFVLPLVLVTIIVTSPFLCIGYMIYQISVIREYRIKVNAKVLDRNNKDKNEKQLELDKLKLKLENRNKLF